MKRRDNRGQSGGRPSGHRGQRAPGQLLNMLARAKGARRTLEIGTSRGYSAIWLARTLPPGGRLISLEYSPKHAEVARANLAGAGWSGVAEVRVIPTISAAVVILGGLVSSTLVSLLMVPPLAARWLEPRGASERRRFLLLALQIP